MTKHPHDRAEILRALSVIVTTDQVTELRALGVTDTGFTRSNGISGHARPYTVSGYFNDPAKMADAALGLNASGIYFTPNPVNPALLARASNKLLPNLKPTTGDADILYRHWLLVDLDPARPAGISASDSEHDAALALSESVAADLKAAGWPDPIRADSGNGAHLLFRVALPVNDSGLCKRVLAALAFRYDTDAVKVDQTVFNPARIWKLYGTLACKGDSTTDRPHRLSRMLSAPAVLEPVPYDLLEVLAAQMPTTPTQPTKTAEKFNVENWIRERIPEVGGPQDWNGGRRWVLPVCPWNPDHTNRSAFVVQFQSGALAAGCHHNGCAGKGWHDLRDTLEPGWRNKSATCADESEPASIVIRRPSELRAYDTTNDPDCLLGSRFLCRGGALMLVGQAGLGKSSFAMQSAVSWALGQPLFGIKPVRPLKSVIVQAENDLGDLAEQYRGCIAGLGLHARENDLEANLLFIDEHAKTGTEFIRFLAEVVDQHGPDLLWLDPLLSFLGDDVSSQQAVSKFLRNGLNPIAKKHGCAFMVVHHTGKPSRDPKARNAYLGGDYSYIGIGSSELANWPRAIMVLREASEGLYELRIPKRGKRAGLTTSDSHEQSPATAAYIQHGRHGICWERAEVQESAANEDDRETGEEVLAKIGDQSLGYNDILRLMEEVTGLKRSSNAKLFNKAIRKRLRQCPATKLYRIDKSLKAAGSPQFTCSPPTVQVDG